MFIFTILAHFPLLPTDRHGVGCNQARAIHRYYSEGLGGKAGSQLARSGDGDKKTVGQSETAVNKGKVFLPSEESMPKALGYDGGCGHGYDEARLTVTRPVSTGAALAVVKAVGVMPENTRTVQTSMEAVASSSLSSSSPPSSSRSSSSFTEEKFGTAEVKAPLPPAQQQSRDVSGGNVAVSEQKDEGRESTFPSFVSTLGGKSSTEVREDPTGKTSFVKPRWAFLGQTDNTDRENEAHIPAPVTAERRREDSSCAPFAQVFMNPREALGAFSDVDAHGYDHHDGTDRGGSGSGWGKGVGLKRRLTFGKAGVMAGDKEVINVPVTAAAAAAVGWGSKKSEVLPVGEGDEEEVGGSCFLFRRL